ncbi:hypothetical protein SEA_YARA_75 [Streptomyces phage Yara]|nr:hypothetical protein SEA_YARA_75 [Streptomyces phage Yara]
MVDGHLPGSDHVRSPVLLHRRTPGEVMGRFLLFCLIGIVCGILLLQVIQSQTGL